MWLRQQLVREDAQVDSFALGEEVALDARLSWSPPLALLSHELEEWSNVGAVKG